ncbi:hypothetical protein MRCP2_p3140 (plasmid) [Aquipseudomonas alcaligenes]|nr:hypothetical protein MRCP2_p3140 [Pseudomonas alcaligenes]
MERSPDLMRGLSPARVKEVLKSSATFKVKNSLDQEISALANATCEWGKYTSEADERL